eukprot:jgi/Pico_ML_1/53061/g3676.t1
MGLLEDALQGLDELFLLVVVGEFNAGKSSLINALLGTRALPEGALPTTNEISLLRYPPDADVSVLEHSAKVPETVQEKDGYFVRYIPAPLLRDVAIVDTPGTNVVLERQQQLTEEFVPRADLVLFVMSADRPFSGSEVKFLRYIREWGKKVVFVLNKKDALQDDELEEVISFVADNACRLLNVDGARVLPFQNAGVLSRYVFGTGDPNDMPISRRGEIKGKVKTAVEAYTRQLQAAMKADFDREIDGLMTDVQDAVDPLLSYARRELDRVLEWESRRSTFESRLEHLRDRVRRME